MTAIFVPPAPSPIELDERPIKIISCMYNPGDYLEKCVNSILTQKYENFKVIFINDCSTDGAAEKYIPKDDGRVIYVENAERKTALENIFNAIMEHTNSEDLVVLLDSDDWFSTKFALKTVNEFFIRENCWVSWGSCTWYGDEYNRKDFSNAYTKEEFGVLRRTSFKISHLRVFYSGLFKKIKDQDKDFSIFKDKKGDFYKSCYDVPIMFSICEMAGFDKCYYNPVSLMVYNRENALNEFLDEVFS